MTTPTDEGSPGKAISNVPARVLAAQLDLTAAWERARERAGMAGVDGVSVGRFASAAEAHLNTLRTRLAAEEYRPSPLRMAELEKTPGGARRLLLVPCVLDRIAQGAVARWLGARWNPNFDPASFAYRPGMGVDDALRHVARLRDEGYRWVLDADIKSFFDSIDHNLLLARLASWLGEHAPMLRWIRYWIEADIWDGVRLRRVGRGVPQGSPLSPLLANYYLDAFDRGLRTRGFRFTRYADDFLVLARTPFELSDARVVVEELLESLRLSLSPEKTRTTSFDKWFRFLGAEMQGDCILRPFEKKKTPHPPVFIAPVMPRALLAAYGSGFLKSAGPFIWNGNSIEKPLKGRGDAVKERSLSLQHLALGNKSNALDMLRGRLA